LYPHYEEFLKELVQEGQPPEGLKLTRAMEAYGYTSPGEMSDWVMAGAGILSTTPELGLADTRTEKWFLDDPKLIMEILDKNYPLMHTTFRKIGYQLEPTLKAVHDTYDNYGQMTIEWVNKGLSDSDKMALVIITSRAAD
jgi:hypothetical protein